MGMFPLFIKRTADVLVKRLSVVFRRFVCMGSFPACWRQANATPILMGPPSSSVANYRPISIASILSKAIENWCRFASDDLWNAVACLRHPSLFNGKVWVPVMHFCVSYTLQSSLESGQEARIEEIYFSAAFDRVTHH